MICSCGLNQWTATISGTRCAGCGKMQPSVPVCVCAISDLVNAGCQCGAWEKEREAKEAANAEHSR